MCNYRKKLNLLHHVTIYNIIHFVFAALLGHFFIFKNTFSKRIENWRRRRVSTPEDPAVEHTTRHLENLCRRQEFRKIVLNQPTLCCSEINNNNNSNSNSKSIMVTQCFVVFKAHPHFCDPTTPEPNLGEASSEGRSTVPPQIQGF